jgi:hypothetical protein
MENFTDINFVSKLVGLTPNKRESCPSCDRTIDAENPLIDPERYSVNDYTGYCLDCYDPTPP